MSLTKTITLPVTYVTRDGAASTMPIIDGYGNQVAGRVAVINHAPGTPLTLPAETADALLAQFGAHGAEEVDGAGFDVVARAVMA